VDELPAISIPAFPRANEFAGLWAIEPRAGAQLWRSATQTDLHQHVEASAAPRISAAVEMQKLANGRSIAVILATGTLMKQASSFGSATSTVALRREIRKAANDPEVAGILLAIDSPGGTVAGIDDLASDVKRAREKKPVWAQVEDLGASAAYWLASQAEKIHANSETALVGSIGTIITVYDVSRAAANQGIEALVFATGPLKGSGAPGAEVTDEQRAYYQRLVDSTQLVFDRAVKDGRGFNDAQLSAVRSGEVFLATEAMRLGLIDAISPLDATLQAMARELTRPTREVRKMEDALHGAASQVEPTSNINTIRQAAAAEVRRIAEIRKACNGRHADIEARAIEEGWDATRAELEVLRAERPTPAVIVRDNSQTVEGLQAALILRAGGKLDNPVYQRPEAIGLAPAWLRQSINSDHRQRVMESAWRFRDMSLLDVCRAAVQFDGKEVPHSRQDLIRAAVSGGSLTNIFTTNINTMVLASYGEAPDTTAPWTSTVDVADFKTNERPRLVKGGSLARLPRGGEADHMNRSDVGESYKIARYAGQVVISEQDIIDDAFNAFADIPREMGLAASRLRPDLVYAILLANPTLTATARALFNTTDGNLGSTSALAADKLRAAVAAMMLVTENGVNLNLMPTHLLIPPSLKHLAYELTNSSQILIARGGTTDTTVERGSSNALLADGLIPVADARLENGVVDPASGTTYSGSSTSWFLACAQAHTIEVAYLRGTGRAPQVRNFTLSEGRWGMGWDIAMDIGAKAMDWRGLRKTTA